jgi:X box-binding protein 1
MTTDGATVIVMNLGKGKRALRPLEEIGVKVEPVDVDMDYDGSLDMFSEKQNGRKRQRLDHLSTEEKIMRRKMKNRVAAQSARDRKKALMDDLEDKVNLLEKKLASYEKQNRELIAKNEQLCKRNEELMKRLQERELESKVSKSIIGQVESSSTEAGHSVKAVGHASSINVSLPKKQACPLVTALWMMHCVGSMILKPTSCSTPCKTSLPSTIATMNPRRQAILEKVLRMMQRVQPSEKWWGPQQSAWNPSKN